MASVGEYAPTIRPGALGKDWDRLDYVIESDRSHTALAITWPNEMTSCC